MAHFQQLSLALPLHATPRASASNASEAPHVAAKQPEAYLKEDQTPALALQGSKHKAAGSATQMNAVQPHTAARVAAASADHSHSTASTLKLPRQLQAALDRVSNSDIIHAAAAAAAAATGASSAPLPKKKTKITAGLWVSSGSAEGPHSHSPFNLSSAAAATAAENSFEWSAAQTGSNAAQPAGAAQPFHINLPSAVPASHVRVQLHSGIIDAAAAGPIAALSIDPSPNHTAHPSNFLMSRPVFPPPASSDTRTIAVALTRYMDKLLQKLPDSALCRALLQARTRDKVAFVNEDLELEDEVVVELRDAACEQLLKCFAHDGVFTQTARDIFAALNPHEDEGGSDLGLAGGSDGRADAAVAVETKLLVCNTVLSEIVRSCSASCVEHGLLIDRCFALARDAIADLAFDHDSRYSAKMNAILSESRGLRRRIVELEQNSEAQDAAIAELKKCIGNFEQSMKTLKNWLDLSRKEEAAAQHSLEIAKSNLQQERAVGVQLRTTTSMLTSTQIEVRQKMEDALKEVVRLTEEVATLQSVKSKSGMQKLASEAGLGGMRVTDKLKNALKQLAVTRNDLMKATQEKAGIGEELKTLTQERDSLRDKLSNLSPKLDQCFARETELMADLESESNARKRLAAAADEQKIVILDLQKQLTQLQTRLQLNQKTRAKAGDGDEDALSNTSQLLARTRIAAEKSSALFADLEGDMPINPNDKCIQAEVQGLGGKLDQASLFQNLLDTAKAEVALSRTRLNAAEKEIEQHLAQINQQRAHIYKLENAPPPPGPDTYEIFCQTNPIFVYSDDMSAKVNDLASAHRESLSAATAEAAEAAAEVESLRSEVSQLAYRYDIECKSVDALRSERSLACSAILEAIGGHAGTSEGKSDKKSPGKEKGSKEGKEKEKGSKESKEGKEKKASKKKSDHKEGNHEDAKDCISGRVSAHISSCSQTAVVRSDTNESVLVCAAQLAERLEAAAQNVVSNLQRALAAAEQETAAAKKELTASLERCGKAEESLNKMKNDKDVKAKAAEAKAAEDRARKEAEAAAAAVAAQFAAAAAAEAAAAKAAADAKKAIAVEDAAVQTDGTDGAGTLLSRMFEGKLTLANLTVQLQNIRAKGLFKDKSNSAPSKLELQLSQQVTRLSSDLTDMHLKLATIIPDYVPPTPEKMEQYSLSDAAAAVAIAEAKAALSSQPEHVPAAPAPAAKATQDTATVANATQTSRANTSHGPQTPEPSGGFSLADEARRLKHEDRILREKIRQLEMTLSDAEQTLLQDATQTADFRALADSLRDSIGKERNRDRRQVLAGKLEIVEEQQLEASGKEAASDSRVRKLKTELFSLQHSRFLIVSSLDQLIVPPPVAITITREKLAVALDVEAAVPSVTGIKATRPPAAPAQICSLCRLPMMDSSVTNAEIGLKDMQQRAILLKKETDAIAANMAEFIAWKHQQGESQNEAQQLPIATQRMALQSREALSAPDNDHQQIYSEAESAVALNSPASTNPRQPSPMQPPPLPPPHMFSHRSYLKSPPPPARRGACAMSIDWPKQEAAAWLTCRDALLGASANGWAGSPGSGSKASSCREAPLPLLQLCRLIEDAFEDAFKSEILCSMPCAAIISTKSFPAILCSAATRKVGDGNNLSKTLVVRAVLTAWSISSSSNSGGGGGGSGGGGGHEGSSGYLLLTTVAHALASGHWGSCCMSFFLLLRAMLGPSHVDTRIERNQLMQAVAAVFAGSKWASNAASAVNQHFSANWTKDDCSCHEVITLLLKMFVGGWEAYTETMKDCLRKAAGASSSEADSNVWLNEEAFSSVILGMCPSIEEPLVAGWWRGLRKLGDGFHSGVPLLTVMMLIDRQRLFMMEIGVAPLGNRVAAGANSLAQATEAMREQEQAHAVQTGSFSPLKMKTAAVVKQRLL